jgi:hypothetical protein
MAAYAAQTKLDWIAMVIITIASATVGVMIV